MTLHLSTRSGGRSVARRFAVTALVVCGVMGAPPALSAGVGPEAPRVLVREDGGVYRVTAQFHVPEPQSTVLAVLTDYEHIPRFMPDVRTSIVRERFAGGALVEQEAVSRMLMFSKRVHLLLEVHEEDGGVRFSDSCGRSFISYTGAWRLANEDGRTLVTYELEAEPSFDVPEFLLVRLLKRDAKRMIERLRTEIAARPHRTF